jgi:hypothetical protein
MSTEDALREVLSDKPRDHSFDEQLKRFKDFEKELERSGYTIQRETFSIPLMDRVAPCVYPRVEASIDRFL